MPNYNFLRKLLPEATQLAEREASQVPGLLVKDAEVLGEGMSKAAPKELPPIDADTLSPQLNDVNIPSSLEEKWNKFYKPAMAITAAGGTGIAASSLMGGGGDSGGGVPSAKAASPSEQSALNPQQEAEEPESELEKEVKKQIAQLQAPSAEERVTIPPTSKVDFGNTPSVASLEKLQALQKQMNEAQQQNEFGRIGAAMATGMSGVENKFEPIFADREKRISQMPDQYLKQVQFEKEDPNSAVSQGYRDLAKSMHFDIVGNASAADIEKQFPQMANIYNQQVAQAARRDIAHENRLARLALMQMNQAKLKDAGIEKLKLKDEDRLLKLNEHLNSPNMGSARNALGRNQLIINGADKIGALISSQKNPDDLTGRQVYEIAKSLDGMLSVGAATIAGTKELKPKSIMSELAAGGEYVLNRPVGAKLGSFVRNMKDLIEREKKIAMQQNAEFKQQLLAGLPEDFTKRQSKNLDKMLKVHSTGTARQFDPKHDTVKMKTKDGKIWDVPREKVKEAKARGAEEV